MMKWIESFLDYYVLKVFFRMVFLFNDHHKIWCHMIIGLDNFGDGNHQYSEWVVEFEL